MAATRALRFSDHVTKRNGGSGNENVVDETRLPMSMLLSCVKAQESKLRKNRKYKSV